MAETPALGAQSAWDRAVSPAAIAGWTALFLGLHLVLAACAGLSVDEAHYALYAVHLDWSYFDHPPLAGWLQVPAVRLGGGDFAVRLAPLACWLATLGLLRRLAERLFPGTPGIANTATLLALTAPMLEVLGVALLPDSVLLTLTCAVMLALWPLTQEDPARLPGVERRVPLRFGGARWCAVGVLLGLCGLSKYSAIFVGLSAAVLLLAPARRRLLRTPGPWIALAAALALVSPVFLWNARHGWSSFAYQAQHALGGRSAEVGGVAEFLGHHSVNPPLPSRGWSLGSLLGAAAVQAAAYGPALIAAAGLGLRRWRQQPGVRFCAAFALLPLSIIAVFAGWGGCLPHWTAFAWTAALPLAAFGLHAGSARARRWVLGAAVVQAIVEVAVFLVALSGAAPLSRRHVNPFADLYGWKQAGAQARRWAAAERLPALAVSNWTLASRLAWYARPLPVHVLDERHDQFELWFGREPAGESALWVNWSEMRYQPPVDRSRGFERCRLLGRTEVTRGGGMLSQFEFFAADDWRGPLPPRRAQP